MRVWLIGFILACPLATVFGDTPKLGPGERVRDGEIDINVPIGHAVPWVVDWNHDGKKDLVVGQFQKGRIRLYVNHGTDLEPRFQGFEYIRAGDAEISLPAG